MKLLFAAAVSVGLVAPMEAFTRLHRRQTQPLQRQHRIRPICVGGLGWDNDNFLNSLSGSDKDRDDANERYFQMSRFGRPEDGQGDHEQQDLDDELSGSTPGAELTPDMVAKVKASHTPEEEASGGGKMFREMMARAKQQQQQPPPQYPAQQQQQQYPPPQFVQQQQPPPQPQQNMDPSKLSMEEQARMFREMMQQQQLTQTQASPPSPYYPQQQQLPQQLQQPQSQQNYMAQGVDSVGRRIGRNRDADAINNSADVYFAQLKRDSTSRNMARYSGDDKKANVVFGDPSIQDIKVHVNPYLEEQRQKEKEMLETSPEEMILPEMFQDTPTKPRSYSGISYKEKLKQRQQQQRSTEQGNDLMEEDTVQASPVGIEPAPAPAPPVPSTLPTMGDTVSSSSLPPPTTPADTVNIGTCWPASKVPSKCIGIRHLHCKKGFFLRCAPPCCQQ